MSSFDVFLSYHWRDHAQVEALAQRLRGASVHPFLDRWYLAPGTNWVSALETTLANCKAVAVCVGAEMGPWQQREQYSALDRQVTAERSGGLFPVIPVLLPGSEPPLGFLHQHTWVDLRQSLDDPVRFEILVKAIRGEAPGPDVQPAVQQTLAQVCPYRGLLYFREEDAEFFFGREAATRQLVAALEQHALVAMVGASGSGKSSVVRAGLIPALRRSKSPVWDIATLVPGDRPLHALAAALMPMLEPEMSEVTRLGEINLLAEKLASGGITLRDVVERVLAKQPGTDRLLLVVDQWEELFTLTEDEAPRRGFIDSILEGTSRSKLSVVLTLRGDFFGRAVTAYRPLSDRLQGAQVNLGPMNEAELRRAIEEPARKVALSFEPGLVDTLLADAGDEPGNLPLVEFVLRQLWEQRKGGLLHKEAYEAMGRLTGAIAQKADAFFAKLSAPEREGLQRVFARLVHPGEGEHDTRRRAGTAEFSAGAAPLIKQLSDERLLVTSKAATGDAETVEVAHEALIQNWQLLRGWVNADRQFIAWQQDLSASATKWQEGKRSADLLLRGVPLAQARDWQKKKPEALSDLENQFVAASAQRRNLRRGAFAGAAALVLVTIGYFFAQTVQERKRADFARKRAEELVNFMVFDLRDKLQPIGRLDLMDGVNASVNAYYEKIGARGATPAFEHRRFAGFTNRGDTLLDQGDGPGALAAYRKGLAIAEALAARDPANTQWQRDLSVSHNKIGDVLKAQGDGPGALAAYRKALTIREALAARDPANTQWQRDLSVSYMKIAIVLVGQNQRTEALQYLDKALSVSGRLAKVDPSNATWKDDLEWVQARISELQEKETTR
jgi:tetratricopeptide (TPR) repeat protein/energy-coupling factor transporter ATP-binding protein EcfA2